MYFEILNSSDGEFYVNLVSSHNGQILFTSETYTQKHNAFKVCRSVINFFSTYNEVIEKTENPEETMIIDRTRE